MTVTYQRSSYMAPLLDSLYLCFSIHFYNVKWIPNISKWHCKMVIEVQNFLQRICEFVVFLKNVSCS